MNTVRDKDIFFNREYLDISLLDIHVKIKVKQSCASGHDRAVSCRQQTIFRLQKIGVLTE